MKVMPGRAQVLRGRARVDKRTKNLVQRLKAGEIAVIDHTDLDELAARALVEKRVQAVINLSSSVSGRYPNTGPGILLKAGIPHIDQVGWHDIREGDLIEIRGAEAYRDGQLVARGRLLTKELLSELVMLASERDISADLGQFLNNTLEYVMREKDFFLKGLNIPPLKTRFRGRHALVVARGRRFKEDLAAVRGYIQEFRPVLVGVDGGADALLEHGFQPDVVIGDMDSVSDRALLAAQEVLVHAYPGGFAPGLARTEALGLEASVIQAPGTSEDLALLLAYEMGAELIVAVGTHTSFLDFVEKGRSGMASTFLVRLKIGSSLVDARGVSLLYKRRLRGFYVVNLLSAALVPLIIAGVLAPQARLIAMLWWVHFRIALGM